MERAEAEAIYDAGRETVVAVLLRMDEQIQRLTKQVEKQGEEIGELKRSDPSGRPQGAQPGHRAARIAVAVTEHRLRRRLCPACSKATRAELPADVPATAFGPRVEAAVATLAIRNRVSRRDTVELARELFGAGLASGTVDAILARTGEALAEPYEDLRAGAQRR